MKCEKCGQDNVAQAEFCTWCGTKLDPVIDSNVIPSRDLGQLISHTFHLYGKNFWQFILIGLPPQILGFITLLAVPELVPDLTAEFGSDASREAAFEELTAAAPSALLVGLLTFFATVIAQGATIHAVARQYLGQAVEVMPSLQKGLSKSLILIIAAIIAVIGLMAASLLIVILVGIPLIIFLIISWAFIFPLIVIEGAGPVSALAGSYSLVKGNRWRVLGIGIVFILINFGIQVSITIVAGIIGGISDPLGTVFSTIGTVLLAPVMFIGLTVVYFDLRSAKYGLTLDSLAVDLDPSATRATGTPPDDDLRRL